MEMRNEKTKSKSQAVKSSEKSSPADSAKKTIAVAKPVQDGFGIIDTTFAKGIAILFLLFHHLFYLQPKMGLMLDSGRTLEYYVANAMKVCVAMFLLLSGYGIFESTKSKAINYFQFMKKNLVKILMNYWFIWLLFVPVGFLIIGPDFLTKVYYVKIAKHLAINFTGLQELFMKPSIISAWWFISLIIAFYAVFPLIKWLMQKSHITAFATLIGTFFMAKYNSRLALSFFNTAFLSMWLFSFVAGCFIAKYNLFSKLKSILQSSVAKKTLKFALYILLLSALVYQRMYGAVLKGTLLDGIFAFFVIAFGYEFVSSISVVKKIGVFLGEHSFNIFLFHSFIYLLYFKPFIYSFKIPVVIFAVLLGICLILSVAMEKIKAKIKFYEFQKYILR